MKFLAIALIAALSLAGPAARPAAADDKFCGDLEKLGTVFDSITALDNAKSVADITKASKSFDKIAVQIKGLESKAPGAIKTDYKTFSKAMADLNAILKKLSQRVSTAKISEADKVTAELATMKKDVTAATDNKKVNDATTRLGKWTDKNCPNLK